MRIADLCGGDRRLNVTLEKLNILVSDFEFNLLPAILKATSEQKFQAPLLLKFNTISYKTEVESKKNSKKNKSARLTHTELLTKCYDYCEIP